MRLSILLALLASSAGAAVIEVPARLVSPRGPAAASSLAMPVLASPLGSISAPAPLPLLSAASAPSSRDVSRDVTAAKLSAAGFDLTLEEHGLILWQILNAKTRSGDRTFLTVSLPPDGRPIERGPQDPKRRAELERRIAASEKKIAEEAARILGMDKDTIAINARLVESCCGAGCQPCLLMQKMHAKKWTGLDPREPD